MRLIAVTIAFLALLAPCIAVPDSVTTGPYKVSFDLGLDKTDYNVIALDPKEVETLSGETRIEYSVDIKNKTGLRFATITTKYNAGEQPIAQGSIIKLVLDESEGKDPNIFNYRSDEREIDGASGAIASFTMYLTKDKDVGSLEYLDAYHALYQSTFDRHVVVEVMSTYPWEEGTLQLLKTIHVEKA